MLLLIAGVLNIVYGIAAIGDSKFFTENATYIISGLHTWGWILLIVGVLELVAAFSLFSGGEFGRWFGIFVASLNAIGALLSIPAPSLLGAGDIRPLNRHHLQARRGPRRNLDRLTSTRISRAAAVRTVAADEGPGHPGPSSPESVGAPDSPEAVGPRAPNRDQGAAAGSLPS